MAHFFGYRCDECGKLKGEVNHWWMSSIGTMSFYLQRWVDDHATNYTHFCSQECATKALAKFMQEGGEK